MRFEVDPNSPTGYTLVDDSRPAGVRLSTDPRPPERGDTWVQVDDATGQASMSVWNGAAWVPSIGGHDILEGTDPPPDLPVGSFFFDLDCDGGGGGGGGPAALQFCAWSVPAQTVAAGAELAPLAAAASFSCPSGDMSVAANGGITLRDAGWYRVLVSLGGSTPNVAAATGAYLVVDLKANGTTVGSRIFALAGWWNGTTFEWVLPLAAGTTLTVAVGGQNFATINVDARFVGHGCSITRLADATVQPPSGGGGGTQPPVQQPPAAPTGLRVASPANDYGGVTVAWDATADTTGYTVELLNEAGAVVGTQTPTSTSARFAVTPDTRYQLRVKAANAAGSSGWSNVVKWAVGHARDTGVRDVVGTRPWARQADVNLWRDAPGGVDVPAGITITTMTVNLSATFQAGSINSPSRQSYFWSGRVGQTFATGAHYLPWFETFPFQSSGGELCGIVLRGTGWSTAPNGPYRLVGIIRVDGTESYTYQETYEVRAEQPCAAW